MRIRTVLQVLAVLSVVSTAQDTSFVLLSPAPGDTIRVGDTVHIRWEHDSLFALDIVTGITVADSPWPSELNLSHGQYYGDSIFALLVLMSRAADSVAPAEWTPTGRVCAGWDWIPTEPYAGSTVLEFVFTSWNTPLHYVSEVQLHILPRLAAAHRAYPLRCVAAPVEPLGKAIPSYGLRGRLLSRRTADMPASVVIERRSPGLGTLRRVWVGGRTQSSSARR